MARAKHAGGRPPKKPSDRLSIQIPLRIEPGMARRFAVLAKKIQGRNRHAWGRFPRPNRTSLVRQATRIGLLVLEREPWRWRGARGLNPDFEM